MKRLLSIIVLAVALVAAPSVDQARVAHHHHRPGCTRLFTVAMGQRAARAVYANARHVTAANLRMLGRLEHCQRNPRAQVYVRWYDRHQAQLHDQRVWDAAHPVEYAVASWFTDYSQGTACGFHAAYGVAHKTLPCGTQVTFYYAGRSVTATVEDRGPYVSGREWDLGASTASYLGFGGVDTVGYRIR